MSLPSFKALNSTRNFRILIAYVRSVDVSIELFPHSFTLERRTSAARVCQKYIVSSGILQILLVNYFVGTVAHTSHGNNKYLSAKPNHRHHTLLNVPNFVNFGVIIFFFKLKCNGSDRRPKPTSDEKGEFLSNWLEWQLCQIAEDLSSIHLVLTYCPILVNRTKTVKLY